MGPPPSKTALLPVDAALDRILALARELPAESAPVDEAVGRALSEDVLARRTIPPWDNSAMDGFAVRSEDAALAPSKLRLVGAVFAGQTPGFEVGPGQAARIMTGAPLPRGADAVVMQEKARWTEHEVELLEAARPRLNVRDAGEDARAGALLLARGTPLGIPEAGLLWSQGLSRAPVPRRPVVAILSTGDELCGVEDEPRGRIVDSNGPSLALAVRRAGGVPRRLGIARDDLGEIVEKLGALGDADVLITSAGVSVGERDHVREALERLGARLDFWRLAIKPGKPVAFGTLRDALVFGLPGNPTSSLVTFELFVRPALLRMQGLTQVRAPELPARIGVPFQKAAGLRHYLRAVVRQEQGELWAEPLKSQSSGALRSASRATHLLVIPEETTTLSPGDRVGVLALSWTA